MGSEIVLFIMLPVLFFLAINFIFQDVVLSAIQDQIDIITCEEPDFHQAYNATTHPDNICALVINENTPYDQQNYVLWSVGLNFFSENSTNVWEASIPYGWLTYTSDIVTLKLGKAGAVVNLVIAPFALPAQVESLSFMWAVEIPMFIMLGFGIYKGISFFT